jgi:hypothetical protein
MMHYLLSLILTIATPLLPNNIPASAIYMGKGLELVETFKIKKGWVSDSTYQVITPYNFIRLKSAVEGSGDLCLFAVDEALKECERGLDRERELFLGRESDDQLVINSYEHRLKAIEIELQKSYETNKMLLFAVGSLGVIAASSLTLYVVSR